MFRKLEIGYSASFEVRREKLIHSLAAPLRLLYLSDLHLTGKSSKIITAVSDSINRIDPSLILLGGDYVDSRRGLYLFTAFMEQMSKRKVVAVAGNHDYFFGVQKLKDVITTYHGMWIEKESVALHVNGVSLRIDGNSTTSELPGDPLRILCLHKPLPAKQLTNYHLVFAGHLHGGQMVWWQTAQGLFPGRLFYKQNFLSCALPHGNYFVSKGLGDTLPVRYNCRRDIIVVDVVPAAY